MPTALPYCFLQKSACWLKHTYPGLLPRHRQMVDVFGRRLLLPSYGQSQQWSGVYNQQQGTWWCASRLESLCGSSSGSLIFDSVKIIDGVSNQVIHLLCSAAQTQVFVLLQIAAWYFLIQKGRLSVKLVIRAKWIRKRALLASKLNNNIKSDGLVNENPDFTTSLIRERLLTFSLLFTKIEGVSWVGVSCLQNLLRAL